MEKIIELKSVELIDILGIGDANIKLIESNIPVSISARGEQLTIKGDSTDITEADAILKEMRETLSSKGALYKDDVDNLIKLSRTGSVNLTSAIKENHVIYHGRKGLIGPRTSGQIAYLENFIDNDVVFGIGPAGTGKTFLSMAFALSMATSVILFTSSPSVQCLDNNAKKATYKMLVTMWDILLLISLHAI